MHARGDGTGERRGRVERAADRRRPRRTFSHAYDATDDRAMRKTALDDTGRAVCAVSAGPARAEAGGVERQTGDYDRSRRRRRCRIVFARAGAAGFGGCAGASQAMPTLDGDTSHLLLDLADHLGSTDDR